MTSEIYNCSIQYLIILFMILNLVTFNTKQFYLFLKYFD